MSTKMKHIVAYVTGGISGMGRAIAERILCQGGKVILFDNNPDGCKIAEEMRLGDNGIFHMGDVRNDCDIKESIEAGKQKFCKINCVLNCAGIVRYAPIYDFKTSAPHDMEIFKSQFDINVLGTFNVIRLIAGVLAENKPDENKLRGSIVNLASQMAVEPPPNLVAYGATKAAVAGMTLPLARALSCKGIRVNSVGPGYVASPMTDVMSAEEKAKWTSMKLAPKRFSTCDECAHLIQFLIENPIMNGAYIRIDSGWRYCQIHDADEDCC